MVKREYKHSNCGIVVNVEKHGVDLVLSQDNQTCIAELDEWGAVDLAADILWRAGFNQVSVKKTKDGGLDISFSKARVHPFPEKWNGEEVKP